MASFSRTSSAGITTETAVFTCSSSSATEADIVIGLNIANAGSGSGTATATVTARITDAASPTPALKGHLVKSVKIPAGGSIELIQGKVVLDDGDIVRVTSDVAVDVWLSTLNGASA